ncbi:MAG: bifunctional phosphoglucose/phosphomannose isomerase [Solirubrobacteraceae bacterium]
MGDLGQERIREVDRSGLVGDVLAFPDHLRDALWRVESAALESFEAPGGLVVAGMGGSAIGGLLAGAALGDRASRPIVVTRDYALPPWASPDAAVLCVSYSGDTEETLAAYDAAGAVGARRIVATTGGQLARSARADGVPVIPMPAGLQPRAAVGYVTVAVLETAALAGVAEPLHVEIDVAAAHLESLAAEWGPAGPADGLARDLARDLEGRLPVVMGAGPTAAVAYRWRTQLNENAKLPAHNAELPEADHNEVEGWAGADGLGRFAAVFLDDSDLHPRVRERITVTESVIAPHAAIVRRVQSIGEGRLERVLSLVLLGDLVSIYLAVLRGVDPTPVDVISQLKARLASG